MEKENIAPKASFQFRNFKIIESNITIGDYDNNTKSPISVKFDYIGSILSKGKKQFTLVVTTIVKSEEYIDIIIKSRSLFSFNNIEDNKLNSFLYQNAPAIVFPYIRAYIATLTTLSGIPSILLPTLNLIGEKENIKKQTKLE